MADATHIDIAGTAYRIADPSRRGVGARAYQSAMVPSQGFDAQTVTKSWKTWGPLGFSRAGWNQDLAVDYCSNLDHRYDWLLTSTAKRNALALTGLTTVAYGVPISDVTKTGWSEGAGDANGTAFEELDEGVVSGTPDDATTYWTTTSAGVANRLEANITSLTDPGTDDGPVIMRARIRTTAGDSINMKVSMGTSSIWETIKIAATSGWETISTTLSGSAIANITDWTDLELAVWRFSGSNALDCSGLELQVPNGTYGLVKTIDEDRGQLFIQRGAYSTQVNPADMVEAQNVNHGSQVTDSVASWNGTGHVALGTADAIQNRTAVVAATSATYANVTNDIEASKLAKGPDRLWIANPDDNKLYFTVGAISTANLSNATQIVDPDAGELTGLYTLGEHMIAATQHGPVSFTDDGSPAVLGEAVEAYPSSANGASGTTLWGWHYEATALGLYAYRIFNGGVIENPVGPGEGEEGQAFEGPVDGYPTAVRAFKDSIWVAYLNPDGTSYIFRGIFSREFTDQTGRPKWYSFRKLPALECHAIGATTGRTNPALVVGEDENIAYYDLSTRGREIADSNYSFDTGGGDEYLTTLMLPEGAKANFTYAKFRTENCVASTDTWALSVDLDDSGSYTAVGSAVTANGLNTVRPTAHTTLAAFSSIKPKLTQVASSSTAPPQIRGELVIAMELRPDMVREITVAVSELTLGDIVTLQALCPVDEQSQPVTLNLPTDVDNTDRYAHVRSCTVLDNSDSTDMVAQLVIRQWDLT